MVTRIFIRRLLFSRERLCITKKMYNCTIKIKCIAEQIFNYNSMIKMLDITRTQTPANAQSRMIHYTMKFFMASRASAPCLLLCPQP